MQTRTTMAGAIAALLLSVAGAAQAAGSTSTSFQVSASVAANCIALAAGALSFGTYDPLSTSDLDTSSNITVKCSKNLPYTVALNAGASGVETARTMSNGSNPAMNYQLFSDSARSSNWGSGAAAVAGTGNGLGNTNTHTVYGRIPKGQTDVGVGTYTDTITVTVAY